MSAINRFLGDTPFRVFLKLLVVSFLVGLMMDAFGLWPIDLVTWVRDLFVELWNTGFAALERVGWFVVLGAAVVVPVFLLLRLLRYRRG